jgi:hypothetical protein
MTGTASSGTSGAATFARYGLAVSAVAFPVLVLLAILLSPIGDITAEGREYVQEFADDLDGYTTSLWLWPLAWIAAIPAMLAVGRVARSRAPVLGLVGLILGFGFVIPAGIDQDEVIYASLKAGLDVDATAALVDSIDTNLPSSILGFTFFVGLLGMVLLGVALLRGRSAPVWAAIALIVGPVAIPLTFFSGVAAALVVAWAVLGVGFVGCALVLFREPIPAPDAPAVPA